MTERDPGSDPSPHPAERPFIVIRSHGAAWQNALALEAQEGWAAHATFMNALHREGFVLLGGPLAGSADVLLVVRARSEGAILERLAADPWSASDLLRVSRMTSWTLRLGSLDAGRPPTGDDGDAPS